MSEIRTPPAPPTWWAHGLSNLAVVLMVTFGGWYLLNDPRTSPLHVYPLPFNAALFWALLFVVWSGFNLEFAGFTRLAQPLRGIAIAVATAVFAIVLTWALSSGIGHFYPDFLASRPDGIGYFTGALFVLFGFATYVLVVLNWTHWPWTDLGMKQPWVGLCEIAFLLMPTTLLWAVLGIPAVSGTVRVGSPLMGINTLLGWFYSIIIAIVLTGLMLENWPWRLVGSRGRVALASLVGNVVLGTVLYYLLRVLAKVLVGSDTVAGLGDVINQFPAQLGVCWVAWMILWGNAFSNKPTNLGFAARLAGRAVITFALAVGTFLLYYYVLAAHLLHEPAVAGGISGNALGFMDWFALIALLYVVGFESYPLRKPAADDAPDTAAPDPVEPSRFDPTSTPTLKEMTA